MSPSGPMSPISGRLLSLMALVCLLALTACGGDDLEATSVIKDNTQEKTAFDKWIQTNYVNVYNIDLKYRLTDAETDFTYTLSPASVQNSIKVAHIVLHSWLRAYDEVAGIDFTRQQAPKVLMFVGSPAMESDNRGMMGQAEGGMKVTLYGVNNLQITSAFLNNNYFQSMHHEFMHILSQHKDYDTDFQKISEGSYSPAGWYAAGVTETDALQKGFISTYAMSEYNEDWAETFAFYIIYSATEWAKKMATADSGGHSGSAIIGQKLKMIRSYMQTAWNIDIDQLRAIVQRRMDEVISGKVDLDDVS